jgi:hypothetical protein
MKDFVRVALVLMCLMSAGFAVQGQTRRTESSCLVMYDPVFWRTKLRLRDDQCRSIRDVNAQYYERLMGMLDKPASSSVSTLTLVEQYLSDRNEKIWNIFQPAQRKRWKRLWEHQYAAIGNHTASSAGSAAFTVDRGLWTVDLNFNPQLLIHRLL